MKHERLWVALALILVTSLPAAAQTGYILDSSASQSLEHTNATKVWHAHGRWWAIIQDDSDQDWFIYEMDGSIPAVPGSQGGWTNTEVNVDQNNGARIDLWYDEPSDIVHVLRSTTTEGTYNEYVWNSTFGEYRKDTSLGDVNISGAVRDTGPCIAVDSTGQAFVAYDSGGKVQLRYSTNASRSNWAGFTMATGTPGGADNRAALMPYTDSVEGPQMGLLYWSSSSRLTFRTHDDGDGDSSSNWSSELVDNSLWADDHVCLRTHRGTGDLFAVVKIGTDSIVFFKRPDRGSWGDKTFLVNGAGASRPQLAVDESNDEVYAVYTRLGNSQRIVYRASSTNAISFGGEVDLIAKPGPVDFNNAQLPKIAITCDTGMTVVSDGPEETWYNFLDLGGSGCIGAVCGDGVIEGSEVCDEGNLDGEDCVSLGFAGGTLSCAADCRSFDTSGCQLIPRVGNTMVFDRRSTSDNRRAMPFVMPEDGTLESVTMYHDGGDGSMILAVYDGDSLPDSRLATTASTPVGAAAGWQTIDLTSSVFVPAGTTVWLAWVYEDNPGIYYETGSPGRAGSSSKWSGGMPDPFGNSSQSDYVYSIYATYEAGIPPPDTDPPTPDPMTWETQPYATGANSIAMEATTASDASGVEYYFQCTAGNGHDSGWQDDSFYEDMGLDPTTEYTYIVVARDRSPDQNETVESDPASAMTEEQPTTANVGLETLLGSRSTSDNRRAMPFVMPGDGTLESVTMYHDGGDGSMILAVYGGDPLPGNRLATTAATPVSGGTGWQTIDLTSPVFVSGGTTIWLAWVFEDNPGIYYETGSPGRAGSSSKWPGGMPDPFGGSSQSDYVYSIYATYEPGVPPPDFDPPTPDPMTWETQPYATGAYSIAMEATTASDASGVEYYFQCTVGNGHDSGWQDDSFYEDTGLDPTTEYTYIVWARDKSPDQHETAESDPASAMTEEQPTTANVGIETLLNSRSTADNRRAMPFVMPEDGTLESVTIYHDGGGGSMILAVYDRDALPGSRLATTATTPVSAATGWQTVDLTSPVFVSAGTTIWLAWVFEDNPGIYYETGSPGRANSGDAWSGGMPDSFGYSSQRDYVYSIYATYSP